MAFSPEELQIIQYGKDNKKSREDTLKALEKFRTSQTSNNTTPQTLEQPSTVTSRLADVGQGNASRISDAIAGRGQYEGQSALTRGIGATATAFSTVPEAAIAMSPEPVRKTVDAVQGGVSKAFKALTDLIGSNKQLQEWTQAHPDATNAIMEVAQGTADLGVISGNILGAKGASTAVQAGAQGSKVAAGAVSRSTQKLVDSSTSLVKSVKSEAVSNLVSPKKDVVGAMGEVLQGKPKDVPKGIEAFKAIDTSGVKTYAELGTRIDKSISDLSGVVDSELSKDLTRTPLSQLDTKLKTKSGNTVSTNYVQTAMEQLKELYEKTGDVQKAADIDELIVSAQADGLTKLEVNDIARVYNSEFGSKAFGVTGEPLTSVNAQLYETIRKGVKGKAREGLGGAEAKAADQTISALYNTKTLVQKNTEAVNKLQQKIADRGIFEKAGYLVSKYADILTGGSIRGFVGGILPRGAGYKTLNAIDLEARLQRNLEIIDKASKASTDAEMTKILSELEK